MYSPTNMRRNVLFAIIRYPYIERDRPWKKNKIEFGGKSSSSTTTTRWWLMFYNLLNLYVWFFSKCRGIDNFDLVKWDSNLAGNCQL